MHSPVFLIGAVISSLVGSLATGYIAKYKGRDFGTWCAYGFLFPLFALAAALVLEPDQPATDERQISHDSKCPNCGEMVKAGATVCPHDHKHQMGLAGRCPFCNALISSAAKKCPACHEEWE